VVVTEVASGSRAFWAEIEVGDVVVEVNRQPVESIADWDRIVSQIGERTEVVLTLVRGERTRFVFLR
jgi:serine protease Do